MHVPHVHAWLVLQIEIMKNASTTRSTSSRYLRIQYALTRKLKKVINIRVIWPSHRFIKNIIHIPWPTKYSIDLRKYIFKKFKNRTSKGPKKLFNLPCRFSLIRILLCFFGGTLLFHFWIFWKSISRSIFYIFTKFVRWPNHFSRHIGPLVYLPN